MAWQMNPDMQMLLGLGGALTSAGGPSPYKLGFANRLGSAGLGFNAFYNEQMQQRAMNALAERRLEAADRKLKEMERQEKLREKATGLMERIGKMAGASPEMGQLAGLGIGLDSGPLMQLGIGGMQGPPQLQKYPGFGALVTRQSPFGTDVISSMGYNYPPQPRQLSAMEQLMQDTARKEEEAKKTAEAETPAEGPGFIGRTLNAAGAAAGMNIALPTVNYFTELFSGKTDPGSLPRTELDALVQRAIQNKDMEQLKGLLQSPTLPPDVRDRIKALFTYPPPASKTGQVIR